jgi:hypothetical protein
MNKQTYYLVEAFEENSQWRFVAREQLGVSFPVHEDDIETRLMTIFKEAIYFKLPYERNPLFDRFIHALLESIDWVEVVRVIIRDQAYKR